MEMLGKELLCPEENFDDEDNISIESFPELPNTEQHSKFFCKFVYRHLHM